MPKRGRKPVYSTGPMTNAEAARRYRQARKKRQVMALRDPAGAPTVTLFDELREAVAEGYAEQARALAEELVARAQSKHDAS